MRPQSTTGTSETADLQRQLRDKARAEQELRSMNERLSAIIDLLPDVTFIVDTGGKVIAWNRAAEELTGVAKAEILGQGEYAYAVPFYGVRRPMLVDLVNRPDAGLEASYGSLARVGDKIVAEAYVRGIKRGQGAYLWGIGAPLFDSDGKRFGAIEVARDLTEFKRIQTDLEASVSLLQTVLDTAADGILAVDAEGRFQSYNRQFTELLGLPETALQPPGETPTLQSLLPRLKVPARFQEQLDELCSVPEAGCQATLELLDGRILETRALPRRRGTTLAGRVWSFHDVTERARAERALAQSERLFKVAFFNIPEVAAIIDLETGRFLEINDGSIQVLGWTRDEVVGHTAAELPIWTSRAERARVIRLVETGGEIPAIEYELRRKDGQPCLLSGSARVVEISGRKCAVLLLRDVTERRRLERDLQNLNRELERRVAERTAQLEREIAEHRRARESLSRSEHKYRELVENANSIILRWDPQGRITFLNEFGQSFLGFREDDIIGRNVIGTIVPVTESGGRDLAELMGEVARHPEQYRSNENENTRSDGERVWIAWTNRPVFDAAGRLVEILSVGNDVTARKRIERELVQAKDAAESADRLKSVFLATMSHELRTPLNSIIGFTGILLQGLAGPMNEEQRKQLSMVQASARHLHALINDVLDLSKIEAGELKIERQAFDFRASAIKVVREMEPLAEKKGLRLRLELAPEVGAVVSDRRRVEQVLLNLLSNAIKFTERGEVTVTSAVANGILETSVRDTGIGIKPEDLRRLFRPFYQADGGLTRKHEGTGLGLSICRRLLDYLGGSIEVESTVGVGSTFSFRLPQS